MKIRHAAAGFVLQVAFIVLFDVIGLGKIVLKVYRHWLLLGDWAFPPGAPGHAMPGGDMLGFVFGMFIYSLIIGAVIGYLTRPKTELP